jgi:riboflavin biosynthesis pyrimidine reductase
VPLGVNKNQPVRVVIDPRLSILEKPYQVLQDGLDTILYCSDDNQSVNVNEKVTIVGLPVYDDQISTRAILDD